MGETSDETEAPGRYELIHPFRPPEPRHDSVGAYLLDLAKGVATLVDGKPAVMDRFREQITVYAGTWTRWAEAQEAERVNRWTPALGRPEDPLAVFSPMYNNPYHPEREAKQLPGFYALLAFLLDRELPHLEKINNGIVTSAEIIQETLLAPGNTREGVNGLRSDISCMVEVDAIGECLNWVSIDLRDRFEENNAGDGQYDAEAEQRAKAMSDADLLRHLAQMLELRPLLELLKDKTWRGVDRALVPWFGEAIRRLKVTREKEVGLLEYRYQCLIGSVRNTQTRTVKGRAVHASPNSPLEHAGELADSFARLALERERASELEREPRPTCNERLARLIPKLEGLERRKESYRGRCSHLSRIGTPDSHGDRYWKERVQPWIDDIELDLVEVDAAVRAYWPYASPNCEQALAIVRRGREPDSMHSVVQGFRILARRVAEHPASEQLPERQRQTNKKTTKRRVKTAGTDAPKKFQPWPNPGDACFIIDHKTNRRLLLHFQGVHKDLFLGSDSHSLDLMTFLTVGSLRSDEIKDKFKLKKMKPSKIVARANDTLNRQVAKKGFAGVPTNTEFIRRDEFGSYTSVLPIHPSMEEFERSQREQPLVDDRWQKDRDAEEDSFDA